MKKKIAVTILGVSMAALLLAGCDGVNVNIQTKEMQGR